MRNTIYTSAVSLLAISILLNLAQLLAAVLGFGILGVASTANHTSNAGARLFLIGSLIAGINIPPILKWIPFLGLAFQILLVVLLAKRLLLWVHERRIALPSVLPSWATVLFSISLLTLLLAAVAVLVYPVLPKDLAYGFRLVGMLGVSIISAPAALLLSPTFIAVELMSRKQEAKA